VIALLTVDWLGGTGALLLTAYVLAARSRLFNVGTERGVRGQLLSDHLVVAAMIYALVLPLVASLVCGGTGRTFGALLFVGLGVLPALVAGLTVGPRVSHDIHRLTPAKSIQIPSNHCACFSGGGCNCPGG
jgi:hypothetical protein